MEIVRQLCIKFDGQVLLAGQSNFMRLLVALRPDTCAWLLCVMVEIKMQPECFRGRQDDRPPYLVHDIDYKVFITIYHIDPNSLFKLVNNDVYTFVTCSS